MDIYIVRDGDRPIVGASARLQGAELIKADHIQSCVRAGLSPEGERVMDRQVVIENVELQDVDD